MQHHPYRKDVTEKWPICYEDLEPHYAAIEKFLDVQTFPDAADIPKAAAMRRRARQIGMGDAFHKAPLAVRFVGPGGTFNPGEPLESHRVPEHLRCRREGTPDLPALRRVRRRVQRRRQEHARSHVRVGRRPPRCGDLDPVGGDRAAPRAGGFEVEFIVHDPEREGRKTDTDALWPRVLRTRRVVVAAGAIGSTYLLLRNRASLGISTPALGTTVLRQRRPPRFHPQVRARRGALPARGFEGSRHLVVHPLAGQRRHRAMPEDFGMYLEDAGFPAFIQWLVEATQLSATVPRTAIFTYAAHQGTLHRTAQVAALR